MREHNAARAYRRRDPRSVRRAGHPRGFSSGRRRMAAGRDHCLAARHREKGLPRPARLMPAVPLRQRAASIVGRPVKPGFVEMVDPTLVTKAPPGPQWGTKSSGTRRRTSRASERR